MEKACGEYLKNWKKETKELNCTRGAGNFTRLVLGCIEETFMQVNTHVKALAEIYRA